MHNNNKSLVYLFLAALIFYGLGLVAFGLWEDFSCQPIFWGALCLLTAGLWIYWDHQTQILTPDEETEHLLKALVKRMRATGSLDRVVEELRAKGERTEVLALVQHAPHILKERARAKIRIGGALLAAGVAVTVIAYMLSQAHGRSIVVVAVGAVGAGTGLLLSGLLQLKLVHEA